MTDRPVVLAAAGRTYRLRVSGPDRAGVVTLTGEVTDGDGTSRPLAGFRGTAALGLGDGVIELSGPDGRVRCAVVRDRRGAWVACRGRSFHLETATGSKVRATGLVSRDEVRAPMAGVLVEVRATPGAKVAANETVAVLEAMKMEYRLRSPREGLVAEVSHAAGDRVELDALVVRLAPESSPKGSEKEASAS